MDQCPSHVGTVQTDRFDRFFDRGFVPEDARNRSPLDTHRLPEQKFGTIPGTDRR